MDAKFKQNKFVDIIKACFIEKKFAVGEIWLKKLVESDMDEASRTERIILLA